MYGATPTYASGVSILSLSCSGCVSVSVYKTHCIVKYNLKVGELMTCGVQLVFEGERRGK